MVVVLDRSVHKMVCSRSLRTILDHENGVPSRTPEYRITKTPRVYIPGYLSSGFRVNSFLRGVPRDHNLPIHIQRNNREIRNEIMNTSTGVSIPETQVTPKYSPSGVGGAVCVDYQTSVTNSYPGLRHDPDGIYWISPELWTAAIWNGTSRVTVCHPLQEIKDFIFPNINTMRGLRELFYSLNPFTDVQNPTVGEIDEWNITVLRHFRDLLSLSDYTVENDEALYLQAHWSSERYKSTLWDEKYPYDGTKPGTWGPCAGSTNPHCGASFIPGCNDQLLYYLRPRACVGDSSFAEGIFSVNTNLPWSIKFARTIGTTLGLDGLGGHTGPFLSRSKMGLSWMCGPVTSSLRVKWGGTSGLPVCFMMGERLNIVVEGSSSGINSSGLHGTPCPLMVMTSATQTPNPGVEVTGTGPVLFNTSYPIKVPDNALLGGVYAYLRFNGAIYAWNIGHAIQFVSTDGSSGMISSKSFKIKFGTTYAMLSGNQYLTSSSFANGTSFTFKKI
jgi:hypothetical protein